MSEKIEGYSYQEHEPTPEKPVEIKVLNLFEVNGIQYTDNIPDNMNIGITKEQYCEYLQLQQENQQLKEENERYRKLGFKYLNEQNNQLKEVIEQIKISVSTSKYAYEEGYQIDDAVLDDILQILDKIKEGE